MTNTQDPNKRAWFFRLGITTIAAFILGASISFDPFGTGKSMVEFNSRGALAWILQEKNPDTPNPPGEEGVEPNVKKNELPPDPPPDTVFSQEKVAPSVPPVAEDRTYILNGSNEKFDALGTFATLEVPGLTPGSHIEVSLMVPEHEDFPAVRFNFPPGEVGPSELFSAKFPQYIREKATGKSLDLSTVRYQFWIVTDDTRFSCKGRTAVMTEGRLKWRFLDATRIFCAKDQGRDELY